MAERVGDGVELAIVEDSGAGVELLEVERLIIEELLGFRVGGDEDGVSGSGGVGSVNKTTESYIVNGKRVFSVRLGNFRSTNNQDVVVDRDETRKENIFHTRCMVMGKICSLIIDGVVALMQLPKD